MGLKDDIAANDKPKPTPAPKPQLKNRSRTIVEGIDEPKREGQGRLHDRIKIDPWSDDYEWPATRKPIKRA